ncbi:hypothetical protein FQN55_001391 [Onygenales sp. PD_40]|nr:hypothetical protein FQN55_001391 [Onygenales sp. PD_40]
MALAPKFAGQKLSAGGETTKHTLEIYLDYVCPFSAKLFKTLFPLLPRLLTTPNAPYSHTLQIILRQQIQPWHPSSTLTHESALAVLQLSPEKFWPYSAALFAHQTEFFDANVVHETRNETYRRLARLAGSVGVDEGGVYELLAVRGRGEVGEKGELNGGNGVTGLVKVMTRASRVVGVHVTPTVFFNVSSPTSPPKASLWQTAVADQNSLKGIEERSISSSFTKEQWEEWFEKNVV